MVEPTTPPATADVCDAQAEIQVCDPVFADFGGRVSFCGPMATLKVFEDNVLVRKTLESQGRGRVLVVDGGGSKRCALVGGNLAALAADNGWAGLVVYGCVRDTVEIRQAPVGVKALTSHPKKSHKGLHAGQADVTVSFAGVHFEPGRMVYADADGIVVEPPRG